MAGLRRLGSSTRCLGPDVSLTGRAGGCRKNLLWGQGSSSVGFSSRNKFEDFNERSLWEEGGRGCQTISTQKRDKIYPKDWQDSSRVFVIHLIERMRDNQNIQGVKGEEVGKAVELPGEPTELQEAVQSVVAFASDWDVKLRLVDVVGGRYQHL